MRMGGTSCGTTSTPGTLLTGLLALLTVCECSQVYQSLGGSHFDQFSYHGSHISSHGNRVRRSSPEVEDRETCAPDYQGPQPPTQVNTTERLSALRTVMRNADSGVPGRNIRAYYVPMDDAHQSEYVSDHDKRIEYISGFSGSAGQLAVLDSTLNKAALWSDGRYFLAGEAELDCNWIFMKEGEPDVPDVAGWLKENLNANDLVGADPTTLSYDRWVMMESDLASAGIRLVEVPGLVDQVWDAAGGRPPKPSEPLLVLDIAFTGEAWSSKVSRLEEEMAKVNTQVAVVTAMDENAWLFNLRGTDVEYNPVFYSYTIVERDSTVTLYLIDHLGKLTSEVQSHLNTPANGICGSRTNCVNVKDYADFFPDLEAAARESGVNKVWASPMSSYKVFSSVADTEEAAEQKSYREPSFVRFTKGQKNDVEIAGLRRCHIRDSVALIEFITMLEEEVKDGKYWDEITASDELEQYRRNAQYNRGLSFGTISGVGPNGAIIHYSATEATKRQITTNEMYLLDSGGQYLDGTTDVTRTFHFGKPTDFQKEAYTRVLMGVIDLADAIWPLGTYGRDIDVLARQPLWSVGLGYRHGTGHGIGAFLNVHEGPARIRIGIRPLDYESFLYDRMFFSDEPGYYEDGEFGIRLETIVMTTKKDTPYKFGDREYIGFEAFTLVPFENNLIEYSLLNSKQRMWLNDYHALVQEEVAEKFLKNSNKAAYDWVTSRTQPIPEDPTYAATATVSKASVTMVMAAILLIFKLV